MCFRWCTKCNPIQKKTSCCTAKKNEVQCDAKNTFTKTREVQSETKNGTCFDSRFQWVAIHFCGESVRRVFRQCFAPFLPLPKQFLHGLPHEPANMTPLLSFFSLASTPLYLIPNVSHTSSSPGHRPNTCKTRRATHKETIYHNIQASPLQAATTPTCKKKEFVQGVRAKKKKR